MGSDYLFSLTVTKPPISATGRNENLHLSQEGHGERRMAYKFKRWVYRPIQNANLLVYGILFTIIIQGEDIWENEIIGTLKTTPSKIN